MYNPRNCPINYQFVFCLQTRLLVTHGVTYLPNADLILVMKDGEISESGTYRELLSKKGAFADFLIQHMTETEDADEEKGKY